MTLEIYGVRTHIISRTDKRQLINVRCYLAENRRFKMAKEISRAAVIDAERTDPFEDVIDE